MGQGEGSRSATNGVIGVYAPVERVDLSPATRSPQDVWHSYPMFTEWARGPLDPAL